MFDEPAHTSVRQYLEQIAAELGIDASDRDELPGHLLVRLHGAAALSPVIDGNTAAIRRFEELETAINDLKLDDDSVDQQTSETTEREG